MNYLKWQRKRSRSTTAARNLAMLREFSIQNTRMREIGNTHGLSYERTLQIIMSTTRNLFLYIDFLERRLNALEHPHQHVPYEIGKVITQYDYDKAERRNKIIALSLSENIRIRTKNLR